MTSYLNQTGTVPSTWEERGTAGTNADIQLATDLPQTFPTNLWNKQQARYADYWNWFTGDVLNEAQGGTDESGAEILRFPLQMNVVRNFARKHAAVLLGEAEDTVHPMVKAVVSPLDPLDGSDEFDEEEAVLAVTAQNILNEIWVQSGGRGIQQENAVLSQFLGGAVFKLVWKPWRVKEYRLPIFVEKVQPEHFMPVWNPKNYNELYEVFEIYKIPAKVAQAAYGYKGSGDMGDNSWVYYMEHWTRDTYSIYLNKEPLKMEVDGKIVTIKDRRNPWKKPPYAYAPGFRDGGAFWGSSFIEDIRGLVKEFNARMADNGDAIRSTVHRKRYMRNVMNQISEEQIANGVWAINLGQEPPQAKHPPEVTTEDPPSYTDGLINFSQDLWHQLLREGSLQNIAFGEDEGSQRSALTLAFRMWPTTARARNGRTLWTDALNKLDGMILDLLADQASVVKPIKVPTDWRRRLQIAQDWHPMIPRDREQEINEVVLLVQTGLMSPERALERLGDVKDIQGELARIQEYQKFQQELQMQAQAENGADASVPTPKITNDTGTNE